MRQVWKRVFFQLLVMPLPWRLRRRLLELVLGYDLDASARIGLSIVVPQDTLVMMARSRIGHMSVIRCMDTLLMHDEARIGHLNWIYGIPSADARLSHEPSRRPELIMEDSAHITSRHIIDCSNTLTLGRGAAIVGYRSQILTHGLSTAKIPGVHTKPIAIGDYALVATGCIVLGGSNLPAYSALGAGSTLRSFFTEPYGLYSGVPARLVTSIPVDSQFFVRDARP